MSKLRYRVLAVITQRPSPASAVARAIGKSVEQVQDALALLESEGAIRPETTPQWPGGPTWVVWHPVTAPRP